MEEHSLDLCKQAYLLYGRGDFDAMLELFGELEPVLVERRTRFASASSNASARKCDAVNGRSPIDGQAASSTAS